MSKFFSFIVLGLALTSFGCGSQSTKTEFAEGAFPPTIPNDDDHKNSWSRNDCLTCHEEGKMDAPIMEHTSLPDIAKEAKCRTCHVTVAEDQATE